MKLIHPICGLLRKYFDRLLSTSWGLDFKYFSKGKKESGGRTRTGQLTTPSEAAVAVCWTVLEIV